MGYKNTEFDNEHISSTAQMGFVRTSMAFQSLERCSSLKINQGGLARPHHGMNDLAFKMVRLLFLLSLAHL